MDRRVYRKRGDVMEKKKDRRGSSTQRLLKADGTGRTLKRRFHQLTNKWLSSKQQQLGFLLFYVVVLVILLFYYLTWDLDIPGNDYYDLYANWTPKYAHSQRRLDDLSWNNSSSSCATLLAAIQPLFDAFLVDEPILAAIQAGKCTKPLIEHRQVQIIANAVEKQQWIIEDDRFELSFFEDRPENDFVKVVAKPVRLIPKFALINMVRNGKLLLPRNIGRFLEVRRRSEFIDCLGLEMHRDTNRSVLPPRAAAESLGRLRDLLVSFDMFPFLAGGTLLGWYRECNIIPHTTDMDLNVFGDEYNDELLDYLLDDDSEFKLHQKLGRLNDTFEFKMTEKVNGPPIDLFFMFNEGDSSWFGGVNPLGERFKYVYPRYDPFCAGDLLGTLVWVTCSPVKMFKLEFGEGWYLDHPTWKFKWFKSQRNVHPFGRWSDAEKRRLHINYDKPRPDY